LAQPPAASAAFDPSAPPPPAAQATADPKLRLLMSSMAECVRTIAYKVRSRPRCAALIRYIALSCPLRFF
jgi:hypothetical protein